MRLLQCGLENGDPFFEGPAHSGRAAQRQTKFKSGGGGTPASLLCLLAN